MKLLQVTFQSCTLHWLHPWHCLEVSNTSVGITQFLFYNPEYAGHFTEEELPTCFLAIASTISPVFTRWNIPHFLSTCKGLQKPLCSSPESSQKGLNKINPDNTRNSSLSVCWFTAPQGIADVVSGSKKGPGGVSCQSLFFLTTGCAMDMKHD